MLSARTLHMAALRSNWPCVARGSGPCDGLLYCRGGRGVGHASRVDEGSGLIFNGLRRGRLRRTGAHRTSRGGRSPTDHRLDFPPMAKCGPASDSSERIPVTVALFLGVFHFSSPGKDAVRVDQIDVMAEPGQAYLAALARKLATYRPTRLLVEVHPSRIDKTNERYRAYLAGGLEPDRSEVEQLAFRIAEESGLDRLHGVDERLPLMLFGQLLDLWRTTIPPRRPPSTRCSSRYPPKRRTRTPRWTCGPCSCARTTMSAIV